MADFSGQIEEIKTLLLSENKVLAYPKLLHLQEISTVDSSTIHTLAGSSLSILSFLLPDIFHDDEEIAAQALKCLGFMIYHPTIVASFGGDDANVIIESLVKVIANTKVKSVCNLGVWCISVQQFSSSLLGQHFHSLLRAIIHAIDNPFGSLSTTFEAMQAVVKLTSSLAEQMKNKSSVWAPPIYRRLVSVDKRERDMSERCLLKTMPIIYPPSVTLSKALAIDVKKKLILAMRELVDQGMKIQSLQAWGWFIRLLGPYAMKNKHLVNEMLKILEKTFSDVDSQVQIASLVAWEGLIDALASPQVDGSHINFATGKDAQVLPISESNTGTEADRQLKRIKLIMAPLVGIMSSKCDVSIHASCLNTWSYLLHKLKGFVNCHLVMETAWEPIFELVFRVGPDNKNLISFNFCLDLLDALILGRKQGPIGNPYNLETLPLSLKYNTDGHLASGYLLKHYPLNCSWNLGQLDIFVKLISILVNHESNATVTPEHQKMAGDGALRLFGSLLEAVQRALTAASITYDEIMQCLNTICGFLVNICKNAISKDDCNNYIPHTCLKILELVTDRLEPSILESPLYKVGLELECIEKLESVMEIKCPKFPVICSLDFEDRVIPVVYLSILYFSVVVNSSMKLSESESLLQKMQDHMNFLLSSYHPLEVLRAFICSLYKNTMVDGLQIWVILVNCLKNCIDGKIGKSILKMETDNIGYSLVLHLLTYPFASWSYSQINLELHIVIEPWKLLYVSVARALQSIHLPVKSFTEDLSAALNGCIDQITLAVGSEAALELNKKNYIDGYDLLCGSVIIFVLEQLTLRTSSKRTHVIDSHSRKSNLKNSMELAARFMKLFWENEEKTEPSHLSVASRFLSQLVNFVGHLEQKEDVLMLIETISSPLLGWLSDMRLLDNNTNYQLQLLWAGILKLLEQCQPSMKFDSSILKFQEPLLEITLDHPNPAISEPTINFWNSTYGAQITLEFPQNLLPVLDKLSRNGKIKLCDRNYHIEDSITRLQRCKVTAKLNKCSKRVEILGNPINGSQDLDKLNLSTKRKRRELTEHQKEVRRAQQGRARDCNGRGPGIRTYTTVDFSQGNEESQDSQDIRESESILGMLRKD